MAIDLGLDLRTLDALPIFAMVADADGTVVYFNRLWHEFTGQPPLERDKAD
jgi:PAS domain-containing protein